MLFRARGIMIIFLIIGLVLVAPLARAQEAEQSEREASTTASDRRVPPKALFDEAHFNHSGFQPLADLFSAMGFEVSKNRRRLQHDILSAYSILVIPGARYFASFSALRPKAALTRVGRVSSSGSKRAKKTPGAWSADLMT